MEKCFYEFVWSVVGVRCEAIMNDSLRSIAIVGNDLHAWSAAAKFASVLGEKRLGAESVSITVVANGTAITPSVLSFDTSVHDFHRDLGVQEADMIAYVGGSYKYGTSYQNWRHSSAVDFLYTYSPAGRMINRVYFHHYLNRLRLSGKDVGLEPFSISAMAASEHRFTHPEPNSPLELIDYALQFDGARYLQFLKSFALERGVTLITSNVESVALDDESGLVSHLKLVNGDELEADFFFDCSGERSQILGEELGVKFTSWSDWFPCDRRMDIRRDSNAPTALLNSLMQVGSGWMHAHSLPSVSVEQYSYCADHISDDDVLELAMAKSCDSKPGDSKSRDSSLDQSKCVVSQAPGVRERFWVGNCVALGAAAGFPEALYFDPLHATHTALDRWLELYPTKSAKALLAEQYNRSTRQQYSYVRDVHALRLATIADAHSVLAENLADVEWPDSLRHRIDLFRSTGQVALYDSDVLTNHQWVSMLIGCGVWPERVDPLANSVPIAGLEQQLIAMAREVKQVVAKLPNHDALLSAICATKSPT